MSKFEFDCFYGGYDSFAVNKEKYTMEQAIEIAKREMMGGSIVQPFFLAIGEGFVRHRAGRDEDGERCVGWWLEYEQHKRSCPCWVFHTTNCTDEYFSKNYEFIRIE